MRLIEVIIFLVISAIVTLLIAGGVGAVNGNVSVGINGITESRCIEGYKFVVGDGGQARQILDEFGKGVRCESQLRK